ncbi:hypothetical protein KIH39_04110 [Telmatocola sphagniphila]|uniref:Lipoprotein n=1 Tax=Telmatocola sphagniphila TaxID=1123043 RepID=A0A8E6EU09_9BACT|nr:hypothetical protein [Telmatocola sphagniphila]QVL33109.1 hypothetical protein KIH39_04110 [Telmatocola sphagniphila]
MKYLSSILGVFCLGICFLLSGCASKVRFEADANISADSAFNRIIDGPTKDQKVRVEISGATEPVNVYVFLHKDAEKAEDAIMALKSETPLWLEKKLKVKEASFEVQIPAKQEFHIYIQADHKSTSAKVKVNSI